MALVSLVDADRQAVVSAVGLNEPWASRGQTPLSHSYCQYVVTDQAPLVITDDRASNAGTRGRGSRPPVPGTTC